MLVSLLVIFYPLTVISLEKHSWFEFSRYTTYRGLQHPQTSWICSFAHGFKVRTAAPPLIYSSSSPHTAAAAESTDRSPRPTSAPAIAQSQVTEGPGAPARKAPKEAVKVEEKRGEEPAEPEPEPTEAWKVRLTCRGPLARALSYRGFQSSGVSQLPNNVAFSHRF